MVSPVSVFEDAVAAERVATRFASGMEIGNIYQLTTRDSHLFFRPESELKNGNYKGTMVTLDIERPRASPKVKTTSVDRIWAREEWRPAPALPGKVKAVFDSRRLDEKA